MNADSKQQHEITRVVMQERLNIWQYQFQKQTQFLKIYTQLPNTISACRSTLEKQSFVVNDVTVGRCQTFESNLLFPLRSLPDTIHRNGCYC